MEFVIDEKNAGGTVLTFLSRRLSLSHRSVSRLKRIENGITVNSDHVTVRCILKEGDTLCLALEDTGEEVNRDVVPSSRPVGILYEDEYLVIPDKPAGMPTHPSHNHRGDCLANSLIGYYSDKPFVFRPVNRLDKDTSGAVIVAKDKHTAALLGALIEKRGIRKKYIALLDGVPEPEEGSIENYIKRKQESIITREVSNIPCEGAKIARTEYRTLCFANNISAVECEPLTGRTHQLRVHFAYIGCPILGDTLYGRASGYISRQALHAYYLEFVHPVTGKPLTVRSPLPPDMLHAAEKNGLVVTL